MASRTQRTIITAFLALSAASFQLNAQAAEDSRTPNPARQHSVTQAPHSSAPQHAAAGPKAGHAGPSQAHARPAARPHAQAQSHAHPARHHTASARHSTPKHVASATPRHHRR